MTTQVLPPISVRHPAPQRGRFGLVALLFGIAAAHVAWDTQLLFSVALSGCACSPGDKLLAAPFWSGPWSILLAISGAGIVIGIVGGLVARRSWRHTREERPGSARHLLESGDGRTQFMAMCGMLASVLFLVALVFGTAVLFLAPLCGE